MQATPTASKSQAFAHFSISAMFISDAFTAVLNQEAQTENLAKQLAVNPAVRQAVIAFEGDLGAGKTTFIRYLLHALGVSGRIKSPSYAVLEEYQTALGPIWHFDFYRLSDPSAFEAAGFGDIFAQMGLKLVEWPNRVTGLLPQPDLCICLSTVNETVRELQVQAASKLGQKLLGSFS